VTTQSPKLKNGSLGFDICGFAFGPEKAQTPREIPKIKIKPIATGSIARKGFFSFTFFFAFAHGLFSFF
jgi:hypothetical protein